MLTTGDSVQKMTQHAKTQPDNRLSREPRDDAKPTRRLRQGERTQATRTALLASAERIFARDGFEAARIEDIALDAGRTRGAFYANFDGKAEIFIALRSITFRRLRSEVSALLANVRGRKLERDESLSISWNRSTIHRVFCSNSSSNCSPSVIRRCGRSWRSATSTPRRPTRWKSSQKSYGSTKMPHLSNYAGASPSRRCWRDLPSALSSARRSWIAKCWRKRFHPWRRFS